MTRFPYSQLPVVTGNEVAAAAALARWAPWWRVDAAARAALARVGVGDGALEVGPPRAATAGTGEALRLESAAGLVAVVNLDAAFAIRVVARFLGDPDPELPAQRALTAGERGVVRYLAAATLDTLGVTWIAGDVVPASEAFGALGPGAIGFDVLATGGGVRGRLGLAFAAATIEAASVTGSAVDSAPAAALTPAARLRLALLPVHFRALAGVATLPLAEVTALASGDVVVLDTSRGGLAAGAAHLPARLTPPSAGARELTLTLMTFQAVPEEVHRLMPGPKTPNPSSLTTPGKTSGKTPLATPAATSSAKGAGAQASSALQPPPAGPDDAARTAGLLAELPVELTAELGRITLTARAALDLAPGAVVRLGRPPGPIALTAQGTTIARGELVLVDGELGIRVTQLG